MSVNISQLFRPLVNKVFARLYFAQTISLLGDAFTWVGLALLAFELGGEDAAAILATSLTLRVTAFVIFSPYAGVLADRIDRKKILYVTHLTRMVIVGFLSFVTQVWQIYILVFLLNVCNGFFTPTYKAVIPQVIKNKDEYSQAISLSSGTYQLLGVLGPGIAGGLAAVIGLREIFFLDAISFIIAALLIFTLPGKLIVSDPKDKLINSDVWSDIKKGTRNLFKDNLIRFALMMEFVVAVAGAQILVNTVGHIKGALKLTSVEYGWAMSAFGIGATIAAFSIGSILNKKVKPQLLILAGAFLVSFSITPANYIGIFPLIGLWLFAGMGSSFVEIPAQTLIAERIPINQQGKVYGAHFAWSHFWWAISYPIAGYLGTYYFNENFLYGGILSFILIFIIYAVFGKKHLTDHQHERQLR